MFAGCPRVPCHRVFVHSDKPRGRPCATALAQVLENHDRLLEWQPKAFDRRAPTLGEETLTRRAEDHPDDLFMPAPTAERQVSRPPLPAIGAVVLLAAELFYRVRSEVLCRADRSLRSYQRATNRTLVTSSGGKRWNFSRERTRPEFSVSQFPVPRSLFQFLFRQP